MLLLFLWQTGINSSTADFHKMPRTWSISTNVTCGPRLPKFDACGIRTKVIIMAYFRSYIWWTRAVGSDSQSDLRTNFLTNQSEDVKWLINIAGSIHMSTSDASYLPVPSMINLSIVSESKESVLEKIPQFHRVYDNLYFELNI